MQFTINDWESYAYWRDRNAAFDQWQAGRTSYPSDSIPSELQDVTNDVWSALEAFDFEQNCPLKYFTYVATKTADAWRCNVTTWTGQYLGTGRLGPVWRDSFGGKRQSIRFIGINGHTYSGTYFTSSGDYCRVKRVKAKKVAYLPIAA